MDKVYVVYWSQTGNTQAMADAKQTTNVPIPPFLQDASYKNAQKLGRGCLCRKC